MLLSDSDETFSLMEIIKSNVSQKNFSFIKFLFEYNRYC